LGCERDRELPQRCGPVCVDKRSDDQRLVDVTHRHLAVDELDQFLKRHLRS
jgi:hypothetical protein